MGKRTEHVNCVVTRTEMDERAEGIGLVDVPLTIAVMAEARGVEAEFVTKPGDAPKVGDMVSVTLEWGDDK